jgi:hypothetical protein
MTRVTVDDSLRARLNGLDQQIELCDESGKTVGHFLPAALYHKLLYASDHCPYTEEELRQHMQEPGGRTLAEIWQRLGRT